MSRWGDIGDECDVVVPVVAGHVSHRYSPGIEAGAGLYAVPDLTHADLHDLWPVCSNNVLQSFLKDIVKSTRESAKAAGFDPRRLPQSDEQAKKMGMKEGYIIPGWMTDPLLVASIERWIRENAAEHVPSLRDLHHGEEESGRLATRLFLESGWNPICDGGDPPRAVRENTVIGDIYRDWDKAATQAGSVSMRQLSAVGLVSDWLINNGSEETCALTAPWITALGFDSVPSLGVNGEDMDDVHAIISKRLRGESFDGVLDEHETAYRYQGDRAVCSAKVLSIAEQVWANMVQRNGAHVGQERRQMPANRLEGSYLQQEKSDLVTPPGGVYKVLDSGLAVPY